MSSPQKLYIYRNTSKTVTCSAEGNPKLNYKWLKNDRTVSSTSNLTLSNVTLAEGGMYKCVVENVAGSEHANIEVIVQCKFIWKSFWRYTTQILEFYVNPFVPNAPFFYPLKTSGNLWFSGGRELVHWERMSTDTSGQRGFLHICQRSP